MQTPAPAHGPQPSRDDLGGLDPDLFDLLCCPESRRPIKLVAGALVSTDPATRRRYRIEAGVPVMLIEESEVLTPEAWQAQMALPGPVGGGIAAVRERHGLGAG